MNPIRNATHLLRILYEYKRGAVRLKSMPLRLWVETTNACNLKCVMCPNRCVPDSQKGLLPLSVFKKIVDEARGFVNDMYLHHRGEPLLNPNLFDMLAYARKAGIKTRFHSNGTLLTPDRAEALLADPPDMVSFSVDGFAKQAYELIRVGADFDRTLANLFYLLKRKRELKRKAPYIVVERIRFRQTPPGETPESIRELTQRFLAAGLDEVIVKEEYTWAEPGTCDCSPEALTARCTFPWYAMVICWDGTVAPCPQDYHVAMSMGNVNASSLREIWNGPAYQSLRNNLKHDVQSLGLCRSCDRLRRKTVGGIPFQYMATFLIDHLVGYNALRRKLGTFERN